MSWSSLLGWLGAVAIVFGLLSLVLQIAAGGLFLARDLPWIWANFGVGIVLLAVALVTNLESLRERLSTGSAKRAGKYGTSAVVSALLALALLGLVAFLSTRYHTRWDWTETGIHTLSGQTVGVLGELDQDVVLTAFYTKLNQPAVKALLDRYVYESERVKLEFVDPQASPARARNLGIPDERLAEGLLHVALGEESTEVDEISEQNVTNALIRLTRTDTKRVYFLEGHGERATSGEPSRAAEGLSQAIEALKNENYEVESLLLATMENVPEDADVLVIAGATRPLLEAENAALARYVESGGALFVMIDPRAQTDLYDALRSFGVMVGENVIVDRVQGLFGRPVSPFAAEYAPHPITQELREATLFHMARSVAPIQSDGGGFTTLVRTGDQSWGETDLETFFSEGRAEFGSADLEGPVPVALAGEVPGTGQAAEGGDAPASPARLVVFGDSDFATNSLLAQFRNRDLFLNCVNWLLGDVEAISIRPARTRTSRLTLSSEQFMQLRVLSLFVLPELIAAMGVFVWWWRRQNPSR